MITRSAAVVACLALLAVAADHVYQTGHTRDILFVGWSSDSNRVLSYSWADCQRQMKFRRLKIPQPGPSGG